MNYTKSDLTLHDDDQDLCIQFQGETIARIKREAIGFARKFLAAPDMYEALKELSEAYNIHAQSSDLLDLPDYWRRAIQSLIKAEG